MNSTWTLKTEIEKTRNQNKHLLLKRLIIVVNEICEKKNLTYFALEELLNLYLNTEYDDKRVFEYKIAMIGADYFALIDEL